MVTTSKKMKDFIKNQERNEGGQGAGIREADSEDLRFPPIVDVM